MVFIDGDAACSPSNIACDVKFAYAHRLEFKMSGNHDHSRKYLEPSIMSREDHKKKMER